MPLALVFYGLFVLIIGRLIGAPQWVGPLFSGFGTGYLIYDLNTEGLRGSIAQSHREIFSPEMNVRTSINMTTDRSFLSDYGEKSGDYNRQSNDSTVNFLKTWQNYALTANLRYTQDYYAASNSATLQTLPEIGLAAVRQQIFSTPVYFDLDSSATNFYRESGVRGQRLYGFPRLTLVSGIPGYLHLTAYGGAHLRAYHTDNIPPLSQIKENDGSILPETGVYWRSRSMAFGSPPLTGASRNSTPLAAQAVPGRPRIRAV